MSNVVGMPGVKLTPEGKMDNTELVKSVERLLERVKRGDVVGLSYAYVSPNDFIGFGWEKAVVLDAQMLASIEVLKHSFLNEMMQNAHDTAEDDE